MPGNAQWEQELKLAYRARMDEDVIMKMNSTVDQAHS
jgi:hypothetical protein